MIVLAASGDTWGISGPTFLRYYLVAAAWWSSAGVLPGPSCRPLGRRHDRPTRAAAGRVPQRWPPTRRARRAGRPARQRRDRRAPGPAADHRRRRADRGHPTGPGHPLGRPPARPGPGAAAGRARTHRARPDPQRPGAARSADNDAQRARARFGRTILLPCWASAWLRLVSGLFNGRPVGYLLLTLVALAGRHAAAAPGPVRTRAGRRRAARRPPRAHPPRPASAPAYATYGAAGAAMGVALYGTASLWALDPASPSRPRSSARPLPAAAVGGGSDGSSGGGGDSSQLGRRQLLRRWRRLRRWRGVRRMTGPSRGRHRLAAGDRRLRGRAARPALRRGGRRVGARPPGRCRPGCAELRDRGVTVVPHGVRLSLGGAEPVDPARVAHLAAVADALDAPLVSEHIAFVRAGGLEAGHLLPVPRSREAVDAVVRQRPAHPGRAAGADRAGTDRGVVRLARRRARRGGLPHRDPRPHRRTAAAGRRQRVRQRPQPGRRPGGAAGPAAAGAGRVRPRRRRRRARRLLPRHPHRRGARRRCSSWSASSAPGAGRRR